MSKYTKRDVIVGVGLEASRGTPESAQYLIPFATVDFDEKVEAVIDEQSYGVIEDATNVKIVSRWNEGPLSGWVRSKAIGVFLKNFFGKATSTPIGDDYHEHDFEVQQDHQHQAITVSVKDPTLGTGIVYPVGMQKTLEINAEINQVILFTTDMFAQKGTATTVTIAVDATEKNFIAKDVKIYLADTAAGLADASETKVKSVRFIGNQEIEKDDVLGAETPDDFPNKIISVEFEITKNHINNTFKDLWEQKTTATPQALRVNIGTGTPTSEPCLLRFDVNQIKITDWSRDRGDDIAKETFTAKAIFKLSEAKMIKAHLENKKSGAY